MKRLFGTDGIRGVAGEPPLDAPGVRRFGAALADGLVTQDGRPCRLVLGRDTRESGAWLRDAVAAGLSARGARVVDAGVISTPGLAFVVRDARFDAGVMISASHNPYRDNGLKVFGPDGFKLSDEAERVLEERILDARRPEPPPLAVPPAADGDLVQRYAAHLERLLPAGRLRGLRLALDCANGAACELAPRVFRHYGAAVACRAVEPDGRNINRDCGSLHVAALAREVLDGGHDVGLAFDGDADRVLAVDRHGRVADGDHILYIAARGLQRAGRLRGDAVVATIMSNLWLEQRLQRCGIALHRAPVGDKYVLERMLAEDAALGGEQSGHVIFRDHATTGDGILTGLLLLDALAGEPQPLDVLLDSIVPCPQIQLNVRVRAKPDLRAHPHIGPAVAAVEHALAGRGRVVLRYSGTEPLARVMVEGADEATVREQAQGLAAIIERELGA
jgi:phosphoglucosamine mutase